MAAFDRLLVALLDVPVWQPGRGNTPLADRRVTRHPGRYTLFSGARPASRHGAQRSGQAPCLPCRSRRCSADCPVRRLTARFSPALGVLVAPALSQLAGAALNLMVCGRYVLRACRVHLDGSSSRRSAFGSRATLSVPVEAALDGQVGQYADRGGARPVLRCGARRPGGNASIH